MYHSGLSKRSYRYRYTRIRHLLLLLITSFPHNITHVAIHVYTVATIPRDSVVIVFVRELSLNSFE